MLLDKICTLVKENSLSNIREVFLIGYGDTKYQEAFNGLIETYENIARYQNWKNSIFIQSTIQNIGADKYSVMPIIAPPLSEQQSIANYLDQKCSEIDELISIKQQKIEKLKDYKKSLIFECVTGK